MLSSCRFVGEGMADMAGIGILVGFVGQAFISLSVACWVFLLSKHGRLDMHFDPASVEHRVRRKRLECVSDILMVGNDIQMLLGSSYMLTAFSLGRTLDLYHLRLVFDVVSFVGPSGAAALICWTFYNTQLSSHSSCWTPRHRGTYIFAIMYLALLILTTQRLSQWSPESSPGRCYHLTHYLSASPTLDKVYVVITGIAMLITMLAAAFLPARWRHSVLVLATLQFPVHLYMAIALRSANQGRLAGHETHENRWDFGQTTAVVLLGMAVREVLNKGWEFYVFDRDISLCSKNGTALPNHKEAATVNDTPQDGLLGRQDP